MPEGIPYVGSNVVAGVGKELNYLGTHCFAYSGSFAANSGPTTYLDFTSGSGYIVGRFEMNANFAGTGGNDLIVIIKLNGINVVFEQDVGNNYLAGDCYFDILIPPYTNVEVQMSAASAVSNINFIGKVYK